MEVIARGAFLLLEICPASPTVCSSYGHFSRPPAPALFCRAGLFPEMVFLWPDHQCWDNGLGYKGGLEGKIGAQCHTKKQTHILYSLSYICKDNIQLIPSEMLRNEYLGSIPPSSPPVDILFKASKLPRGVRLVQILQSTVWTEPATSKAWHSGIGLTLRADGPFAKPSSRYYPLCGGSRTERPSTMKVSVPT